MMHPGERILVVGTAPTKESREALMSAGHDVVHAADVDGALSKFARDAAITVVVLESPPVADVAAFLAELHKAKRDGLVVLGHGPAAHRSELRRHGVRLFLAVPWSSLSLTTAVRSRRQTMGLMNLHDAYLSASLMKRIMEHSPLVEDAEEFTMSDRGRAERLWVSLLAVLVEAWDSGRTRSIRECVQSVIDTTVLTQLIRKAKKGQMREVRGYMFHRDARPYWDVGRTAVFGMFDLCLELHSEFGRVLLTALQVLGNRSQSPAIESKSAKIVESA